MITEERQTYGRFFSQRGHKHHNILSGILMWPDPWSSSCSQLVLSHSRGCVIWYIIPNPGKWITGVRTEDYSGCVTVLNLTYCLETDVFPQPLPHDFWFFPPNLSWFASANRKKAYMTVCHTWQCASSELRPTKLLIFLFSSFHLCCQHEKVCWG